MLIEWLLIALGVVLTVGTAIFVAGEFSLVTVDPAVADAHPGAGDRRGHAVRRALSHLSTELSGAQVGITVTTIMLGYLTQPALVRVLSLPLQASALGRSAGAVVAGLIALVLVNGFSMIFGELVPKNVAISHPVGTARAIAPVQHAITVALRPMITLFNNSANGLLRRAGVEPREELAGGRSAQELVALVRRSAEVGTLDESTAKDSQNYDIEQWNYIWSSDYGSPEMSVENPKVKGHDPVDIDAVTVSPDHKTIFLKVAGLKPVMQMKIQMKIKAADGSPVDYAIYNTVQKVPGQPAKTNVAGATEK